MKRQVFLIYLGFRIAFLFGFWENVLFTSYVACYYCVICSCRKGLKYLFTDVYKIDTLKSLAIFTGKYPRWRFFIINFIKKRLQHRYFPMNIAKCLGTAFYIETSRSLCFSEILCDDRITLDVFWYKIDICNISCVIFFSFVTLRIGKPSLFRIYLVFITKFLLRVTFPGIATMAPWLFWLNR